MKNQYSEILEKVKNETFTEDEIKEIIELVDSGELLVASKVDDDWKVNKEVKSAILEYFGMCEVSDISVNGFKFRDKIPLKQNFKNVRIVPGEMQCVTDLFSMIR